MIIPVKKYLFMGAQEDLDDFFERAQQQGFIEFISPSGKKQVEQPAVIQHLIAAHKILLKQPVKAPYVGGGDLAYANEIANKILALKHDIEKHEEEIRILEAEIARVAPFGDFSMEDIDYIEKEGHVKIQFFCRKAGKHEPVPEDLIYVGTAYDLDYFIAINPVPRTYPDMIEMRIDRPLGVLQHHLAFAKETLHQLEAELKGYAGHIAFLHDALVQELNYYNLISAKKEVAYPLENSLFVVEAWIPSDKITQLLSMLGGVAVHAEQILVNEGERVPTYMKNKGVNRIGEELVHIYDTPSTTDKDPSGWVFWAFLLFFSMIISDAGYGFIFLAMALFLYFKFPKLKGGPKRFLNLFIFLSVGCIVWGVAVSGYFGIKISPNHPLKQFAVTEYLVEKKAEYHLSEKDEVYKHWSGKYSELSSVPNGREFISKAPDAQEEFNDSILLEFSLIIGLIHICLSLLRYLGRSWSNIGWVTFLVGGYFYFPSALHATSIAEFLQLVSKSTAATWGLQMIFWGFGTAVVLAVIQKKLKGLNEIAHVVQVFADVLSYLRLYALALASTIMAETFNSIGGKLGFFFGALAILAGHSVNLLLGVQGGLIHGLRLNFIEWYHYSFEGGGRLLNPLKKLKAK